jgi:hypothetical protein
LAFLLPRGKGSNFRNNTSNITGFVRHFVFPPALTVLEVLAEADAGLKLTTANNDIVPLYIGKLHFGFTAILFICFVIFV